MKYLAVAIFSMVYSITLSQSFPYTFQTWDVKNGLPSNYCNAIAQDADGYLYVGTNNGLFVFNGNDFKPAAFYTKTSSLTEGIVEDVVIDKYNRIWFASIEYGVGLINMNDRDLQIQYFVPPASDSFPNLQILNNPRVSKLCFDSKGYLWVGTRGNGLFRMDTTIKKFEYVKIDNQSSLYTKFIRSLYLYKPDTLFVGLVNGLSMVNPLNNKIIHLNMHVAETGVKLLPTIRKVLPWANDSFMLATDRGTYWLKLKERTLYNIFKYEKQKIDFSKLNTSDIYRFSKDEVWLATEDNAVLFFNLKTKAFEYSYKKSEFNLGISRGGVNRFYKDGNSNMWIAHQHGLSLFQIQNTWFNNFSGSDSRLYSGSVIADRHNILCFKSNALTIINSNTGNVQVKQITIPAKRSVVDCYATDFSPENYILFVNEKCYFLNKKTLQSKALPVNTEKLDPVYFRHFRVFQSVLDTINGRQQFILLARTTQGNILLKYFPDTGNMEQFILPGFEHNDFKNGFTQIKKTGTGKYWISTLYNGLIYVDNTSVTMQYAATLKDIGKRIPDGEITDFTITPLNDIWLLNKKEGLVHLTLQEKNIKCREIFAEQEGLTSKSLYNIVHDQQNNLWITSNTGLFCFQIRQNDFLRYTATNGFSNMNFHMYNAYTVSLTNGYIVIYEDIGNITWFKPQSGVNGNRINLTLQFVQVNEQSINLNSTSGLLSLSPNQNNISFLYDIIDFDHTTIYQVIYKLDHYDSKWHSITGGNELRYTQLPPGKYTFRIKLQYSNNVFSPEKSIQFFIATIWYKTWWFKCIAAIISGWFIYLIIRGYISRKLYQQKKELELQRAVAMERSRISTELHDDLGSGLSTIRILSQSANGYAALEKISGHSRELLQKMTEIVWALNIENDTLDQLISYIRLQSVTLLDGASVHYSFNIPEIIPTIKVSGANRRHIQLMVKEAVHNIIKHAGATQVHFCVSIKEHLIITIADNGNGIAPKDISKMHSNGMNNMKKHIEAVQGTMQIQNGTGLTLIFTIPLQRLSHESAI
ncbi:MAG: hypothetical protein JST63_04050 [Bacteroidetes bacterium]|nr:hypothetical protein [Bacteroidota bacterium]